MRLAILGAVLALAGLGGCIEETGNKGAIPDYAIMPLPKNYKSITLDYLKSTRADGAHIQVGDAGRDKYYGWAVPVTYGAKKRSPGAMPDQIVCFNNNSVQMIGNAGTADCSRA